MATQLRPALWEKSLSREYHRPQLHDISKANNSLCDRKSSYNLDLFHARSITTSYLHSQKLKQSLLESKKAFLSQSFNNEKEEEDQMEEKSIILVSSEHRRIPSKKVSFKIKKTSSIYRRVGCQKGVAKSSVAELTRKFNEMLAQDRIILEKPEIKKLVHRANSNRDSDSEPTKVTRKCSGKSKDFSVKIARKPSVKTKPNADDVNLVVVKTKSPQTCVNSSEMMNRTNSDKMCVRAKIGYLDSPLLKPEVKTVRPTHLYLASNLDNLPNEQLKISPTSGCVRATIEIFERKSSLTNTENTPKNIPITVPKPKVPEKKFLAIKPLFTDEQTHVNKVTTEIGSSPPSNLPNEITINVVHPAKSEQIESLDKIVQVVNDSSKNGNKTEDKTDFEESNVQIINIPAVLPQRRCDSMYETSTLRKLTPPPSLKFVKSEEILTKLNLISKPNNLTPNASFLWRNSLDKSPTCSYTPVIVTHDEKDSPESDWEIIYDSVDIKACELKERQEDPPQNIDVPQVPPRPNRAAALLKIGKKRMPLPEEKIYEELNVSKEVDIVSYSYEYCESANYEDIEPKVIEDDYEYCAPPNSENIYETLPPAAPTVPKRNSQGPLPPRPQSRSSESTIQNSEISSCYESIYNPERSTAKKDADNESTYESIYGCQIRESGSNRDSLISSDQQSNSLYNRSIGFSEEPAYNGKAQSDLSSSDRSDEWVDVSDNENMNSKNTGIIIIRERQKSKKAGWSQHCREQWSKTHSVISTLNTSVDSDSDHHYESLRTKKEDYHDDDYDSFDSDTESEHSFNKVNLNDSGVDIVNNQLPDPPNGQTYVLTRVAATAGKHMRKLRRNWSLTKNDISKSLSRMIKRKSRTDLDSAGSTKREDSASSVSPKNSNPDVTIPRSQDLVEQPATISYQNVEFSNASQTEQNDTQTEKSSTKTTLRGKSFLNKFRRSMSMSAENASELTSNLSSKPKSTFYLTETIDVDDVEKGEEAAPDSGVSLSPVLRHSKSAIIRPQSPPPAIPVQNSDIKKNNKKEKRSSSWYAEVGLFRNTDHTSQNNKRPNTFWYAEVGLYQQSASTPSPSTSSAENSGTNANVTIKTPDHINQDDSEEYYNMKNESNNDYYNDSINSFSSGDTKKDESLTHLTQDIQLLLQDEPLYQFYDAAVLESVCQDGTSSEFDSDGYEEVGNKSISSYSSRPSAMELVSPKKNSIHFSRTLWCEIPEVIQSSVLSTLSSHQKKLQEAKFEMITSEASYLNSLNVLNDHFVKGLNECDIISEEDREALFGTITAVRECSEKLLQDLETCWQDNILLHGVCEIILKHSEENFNVYIPYCENQILLDDTLKRIREKPGFTEYLRELESSSTCQSLTLYSFIMLPMQRITRWPLLIDAVLKRLSPQDSEYLTCQYTLATLNKIVSQCNEAARTKERECEMKKIASQLEFSKGISPVEIATPNRWLIRSGPVTHMQQRNDETKLTFGKRFSKAPLHLFLFNDMLLVTKSRGETSYTVIHYCPRNLVELTSTDTITSLPVKDTQGRNLLFLTLLENQDVKTVEFLLSCNSESDKERWVEALTPPRSDDPNETLYECWDCPQVTAIHNYSASQPDELAVSRGDVINVLRKMVDGWYHGERIRDGQTGWFPANYTVEVANPHVRARNLKQRYRLLAFSENYLKSK